MDHKWGALLVDSSDTQKAYRSAGYSVVLSVVQMDQPTVASLDDMLVDTTATQKADATDDQTVPMWDDQTDLPTVDR